MEESLKKILGIGYEVAATIGEKLGWALNDLIDKAFNPSDEQKREEGGER